MRSPSHSYRTSTWINISKGIYALIALPIALTILAHYTIYSNLYMAQIILNIISSSTLYIVVIAFAIDLTIAGLSKIITIEIYPNSYLEATEGVSISLNFLLKPRGIGRYLIIKGVSVSSDIGLRITGWRYDKHNQLLEIHVVGYPGKHIIDGLQIGFETPLSILKIVLNTLFDKPLEVRVVPLKHKHMFNVEAVVPHLPLIEGRSSRRKGVGSVVMSVREFTPHDDYKKIHWKATARTGKLMVKEYEHRMYRNALIITSIHYWFYLGEPPPLLFLFRTVIDIVETLIAIGIRVALGIITEEDIKVVEFIDKFRVHEVYKALSEVKWPKDLSSIRYTSSNRILRWFVQTIAKNVCRDPCIVLLAIDPLDDFDINTVAYVVNFLEKHKNSVKILLTTPSTLRFIHSSTVGMEDVSGVMGEMSRVRRVLARFKPSNVYLPTVYLKT